MSCMHKLVADVTVVSGNETVMVRYGDLDKYDGEPGWFVPDDFLHRLEDPEDAGTRIVREQLGIEAGELDLSHVESFEGNGFWHLVFHYGAVLSSQPPIERGPMVAAAQWFRLDALPPVSEVGHEGWGLDTIRRVTGATH